MKNVGVDRNFYEKILSAKIVSKTGINQKNNSDNDTRLDMNKKMIKVY